MACGPSSVIIVFVTQFIHLTVFLLKPSLVIFFLKIFGIEQERSDKRASEDATHKKSIEENYPKSE